MPSHNLHPEQPSQAGNALVCASLMVCCALVMICSLLPEVVEWAVTLCELSSASVLEVGAVSFIVTSPLWSEALLSGLCWSLFKFSPASRSGVILRKHAFALIEAKRPQFVQPAHGCRAPPALPC